MNMAAAMLCVAAAALIVLNVRCMHGVQYCLPQPRSAQAGAQALHALPRAGLVPINTADEHTLGSLPGVGQAIAARIVQEREQNGPYLYPEDLLNVSGIGPGKLQKLLDCVLAD